MVDLLTVPFITAFRPALMATLSIVVRNPIHAILWLIATFLVTCGLIFQHFKLGFTAALIIIVYIGAIAILFLFIIMLIPVKERPQFGHDLKRLACQFMTAFVTYVGGGTLLYRHVVNNTLGTTSEFWAIFANQLEHQKIASLPTNELEGLNLSDLYLEDIAILGTKLYQDYAFVIMLVGVVLLFILVAAIILCQED
jgi:NADH-quinone oxidoreductase subunit J